MPRKKKEQPFTTLFYPNQIVLSNLQHEVTNDYKGKIAEINFFLLFNILLEPYIDISNSEPTEYIQVYYSVLRCIFRDNYKQVIEDLVKNEYIQENPAYSTALHFCKSYRIHPKRIDVTAPLKFVRESVSGYFLRKLTTLKTLNLTFERTDEAREHVMSQTSNLMLVPDSEAMEYVANRYREDNNPNEPETYFTYFNNSPLKRAGVDRFGNRVHSVITNMPKVLRRCLRFISAPTVSVRELDIVNSQPFFLSSVTSELIGQFVPDASQAIPIFKQYERDPNFIKFRDLCRDGRVYEYLQAAYEIDFGPIMQGTDKQKRDFTKSLTYGVLFGDYELKDANLDRECKSQLAQTKNDFYKIYKKSFPAVYSLFKAVKSLHLACTVNKQGERKQYANNCLIAQRLESGVIFSHVVQACINNGFTELVTVHDCLLVRADEFDDIQAITINEFDTLNLNPKFN